MMRLPHFRTSSGTLMLQKIRDNSRGLIAKIFVAFVIAVFALFGVETLVGTFLNSTPELEVNGAEISVAEIDRVTQQKTQEFFSNLGEDADLSGFDETVFREAAINELIQRELLRQSALDSGMSVSSATIDRRILQTPEFQVDGEFDEETANILLQSMGYTGNTYRAALAEEALLNQLLAAYSASGFATEAELANMARLIHQKRSFRYVTVGLDSDSADIEITEEEIQAYYDSNQEEFLRPEQVKISYIVLDKDRMRDEIEVTEEEVRALYQEEVARYQAQTERRAAHILFEASGEEEFAAAEAEAASVLARIEAGEEFAALAAEVSDDPGSAEEGGDVGYTTGDSFTPEFEAALQALEVGEVSEPVRTEFGVHLIKLLEMNETEIEPFEARQAELERELQNRQVDSLFIARSEELSNLAFESVDLQEPADSMGLEVQESDWFGRSGGTGITAASGVIDASFSPLVLEEGLNSELIRLDDNRTAVVHVEEHRPPEVLPLEEVSDEIAITLRLERMREQARMIGETIVDVVQSGEDAQALLDAQELSWNAMTEVERGEPSVNPQIMEEVFSMQLPAEGETAVTGFQLNSGGYAVIELQDVIDGTMEDLEEGEAGNMRNFISQQGAAVDFTGFMTSLENRAEISGRRQLTELGSDLPN